LAAIGVSFIWMNLVLHYSVTLTVPPSYHLIPSIILYSLSDKLHRVSYVLGELHFVRLYFIVTKIGAFASRI